MGLTNIQLPSGGTALPIARYVYLVQDATDATRMLGVTNNVYTTFQAAYDAANTLQLALGGTNKVTIVVGNTTAATVGNVTLTADWNVNVSISGASSATSVLGNVTLSNAAGNGYNFGTATAINLSNVTLGTITTTATGATGNAGTVNISMESAKTGNILAYPTNAANTTGNSGAITVQSTSYSTCQLGDLRNGLTGATSTGTTGSITVTGAGRVKTGGIRTGLTQFAGSAGGALSLTNVDATLITRYSYQNVSIINCIITGDVIINDPSITLLAITTMTIENTKIGGGLSCNSDPGGTSSVVLIKGVNAGGFLLNGIVYAEISNSQANNPQGYAVELTACSFIRLLQSSFSSIDQYTGPVIGTYPVIYTDNTTATLDLVLLNCSLLGGTFSIQSVVSTTISSGATYFETGPDVNTTITPLVLDA